MMFLRFLGVDPDPGAGWEPSLCCQNSAGFWGTAVNATSLFFEGKEPDGGGIRGSSIVRTRSRRSWSARASPGELVLALGPALRDVMLAGGQG